MTDIATKMVADCTVRILVSGSRSTGSGFFVAPGLVLTCSHVLGEDESNATRLIKVQWKNQQYNAQIIKAFPPPYPDIALLGIESFLEHPCVLLNPIINVNDALYSYGFPDDQTNGDSVTLFYEGPTQTISDGQEEILLKMHSGQIRPGLSGAPLLNLKTGCVCGLVKSTRDRETDLGGRAIPISAIISRYPYLMTQQRLYHQQNPTWINGLTPAQKVEIKSSGDVPTSSTETHKEIELIKNRLITQVDKLRNRYISGSSRIVIGDLLDKSSDLFIRFRWRSSSKIGEPEKGDIANYILDTVPGISVANQIQRHQKILALSDPGFGKSTLTYKVFCELANKFNEEETLCVPIYINLQDYIGDDEFGTKEWTLNLLNQLAQSEKISWVNIKDTGTSPSIMPYFILDALDEFLSGFSLNEVNRVLKRYIFNLASLVTCRRQYYERYLFMSDFAQNFEKLYLLDWTKTDTDKYTRNYYKFCFRDDDVDSLANIALINIEKSPHLRELCQVPLRLNMTLELLSDNVTESSAIFDLNSLYYVYVFNWLAREASKVNSVLSIEEKYEALKIIAWNFYDEGKIGQNYQSNKFTRQEILKVIKENDKLNSLRKNDAEQVVDDLATRSILIEEKGLNYGVNMPVIRFAHKSFLEYLVASYLNDSILGAPRDMEESFSRTISQEVAQFLKGYINRINDDKGLLTQAVKTSIDTFKLNQADQNITNERKRLTSSQLCYHMGHFASPKIFDFLSRHLEIETDLLVKRSIIIGLSFSGHKEYLNQYVERLRTTRGLQIENEINIGNHLSYFGDQPYDDLNPAEDQFIPMCKHTIEKLIYQLSTEINRGSWRLDLFTLLDIGKFRPISRKDFLEVMKSKLDEFKTVIDNFRSDPTCKDWPEVAEAQLLINSLENNNNNFFKVS